MNANADGSAREPASATHDLGSPRGEADWSAESCNSFNLFICQQGCAEHAGTAGAGEESKE